MIRFSRREDYAIVIAGTLAASYGKKPVPISRISRDYNISYLFLRNLANDLKSAGVVISIEGKGGGYLLSKDPKNIKMGEILSVFSSKQHIVCCSGFGKDNRICPKEKYCIAGNIWRMLNKEFIDKIYSMSLTEFLEYKITSTTNT